MAKLSDSLATIYSRLQSIWRALHIGHFRRTYEPAQHDEMLRATSAEAVPLRADFIAATSGGFLYTPVHPERFRDALSQAQIHFPDFVFVDIGCGRGRALVLASGFGFKRLIGIELSRQLAADAEQVVAKFVTKPESVSIECIDARHFNWPDAEPLFVFLYNPFTAPVLREVLARLQQALLRRPRPVLILYFSPELASVVESFGYDMTLATDDWCLFTAPRPHSPPAAVLPARQ